MLTGLLNPVEPLIMRLQSLLVWEFPRKSAVLLVLVHVLFWVVSWLCVQVYCIVSMSLMVIFFVDTWKKKIWPEIRVPSPVPEDPEGWTPVHPRLLSIPEITRYLSVGICYAVHIGSAIRKLRQEKPAVFFVVSTMVFTCMAALGMYMSGFMIIYTLVMSLMIWPSIVYHNLLKRAYLLMEPAFMWLDYQLRSKCRIPFPFGTGGRGNLAAGQMPLTGSGGRDGRSGMLAQVVEEEEEDFEPSMDPVATAALARAITDSEDECGTGGHTPSSIPNLSKESSIDNTSDDEIRMDDFSLDVDAMPSFDDVDHSDDDLTPVAAKPYRRKTWSGSTDTSADMAFSPSHFDDSDSDEGTDGLGRGLSFPDVSQTVLSPGQDVSVAALTSTLVTQTLSHMMESALQGMVGLAGSGKGWAQASSSGRLPHTGTKITYTKTAEGESIDFNTPEPTIAEDDESCEPSDEDEHASNTLDEAVNNEVAEIEKDFDFLDELDGEPVVSPSTPQ